MNLTAVGAGARTVEAFVSEINEEADPAGPVCPSRPRLGSQGAGPGTRESRICEGIGQQRKKQQQTKAPAFDQKL